MSRCSRAGRCSPPSPARRRACGWARVVTGVTYRNPALLAKQVTTLDTISGGRAILGLGAAWNEVEHQGYGYDFPPIRERMDRLEEALAIIKAMFTEQQPTFHGTYYRIEQAFNVPRPVQPGGPKILVGGGGEQRTLRIAAKYADMTHWFALGLDALKHKTEVLERYCEEIGRDPSTIERTAGAPVIVTETEAEGKAILERIPAGSAALHQGGDTRPGGRADPSLHRSGLHGLHVQQQPVPDARADRAHRRGPPDGRERGAGRGTLAREQPIRSVPDCQVLGHHRPQGTLAHALEIAVRPLGTASPQAYSLRCCRSPVRRECAP